MEYFTMHLCEDILKFNRSNLYSDGSTLDLFIKYFNIKKYERNAKFIQRITLQDNSILEFDTNMVYHLLKFGKNNNLTDLKQTMALYKLST